MSAILKIVSILLCIFMFACGGSSDENNETPDENTPREDSDNIQPDGDSDSSDTDTSTEETDKDADTALYDKDGEENDDETTDEDAGFEELQTGGIYIFSDFDESGSAKSRNILGNGGFLGFSTKRTIFPSASASRMPNSCAFSNGTSMQETVAFAPASICCFSILE